MDIPGDVQELLFRFDEHGFIDTFKKPPLTAIFFIELHGVVHTDPSDDLGDAVNIVLPG